MNTDAKSSAPQPAELVFQLALGYVASSAICVTARLGIADLLADGPLPVAELARSTGANEDALYRTLRALAGSGVFAETAPRTFALTPAAELLKKGERTLRDLVLFIADSFHLRLYADFQHSVMTGEPLCEKYLGKNLFEHFAEDKEEAALFNAAMTSFSASVVPAVLEAYDFSAIGTLVDLAGGHGFLLTAILQKYPALKGIVTDLPEVVEGASQRIHSLGLEARCRAQAADFFQSVPAEADAFIMKSIIHDWDDERSLAILRNCHKAFAASGKKNGKVLLVEAVIAPGNAPHMAKWLDLEMLTLPGGRERTESEFRTLFEKAGFRLARIVPTKSPLCVIEALWQPA